MDRKAQNSITDRVQYTGTAVPEEVWEQEWEQAWQAAAKRATSEGNEPAKQQVAYLGPDRRQGRERQQVSLSLTA
jgi:hypothetical protein